MQQQYIKLKEIIYEITGKCNNKCDYCGSKEAWNTPINNKAIIQIAKNIALFPPEEIDISGGDPLLVDLETHETIVKILKNENIKCKILVNPKSIMTSPLVLKLYDWIGLSINTEDELKLLKGGFAYLDKTTVISNFNLQNVFLYGEIEEFVKKHNLMWQVQYTMYRDSEDSLALYNNKKALAFFSKRVSSSLGNGVRVLIADNANCGSCSAGLYSIGILCDGNIVPCLSMRSWLDVGGVVVGNILSEDWKQSASLSDKDDFQEYRENPLKYIWENRFNKYRFDSFKCCKDHCKNKCVEITISKKTTSVFPDAEDLFKKIPKEAPPEFPGRMVLYGVCPETIRVYGVTYPEGTYVYACPGNWKDSTVSIYAVKIPPLTCESNSTDTKTTTHYGEKEAKDKDNGKDKK